MKNKQRFLWAFIWGMLVGQVPSLAADSDGDGLNDDVETNTGIYGSPSDTGTNPLVSDSDGDGVGDWYEVATLEEDPGGPQTNAPNDSSLFTSLPYPMSRDTSPPVLDRPVQVYILSGQSNMQGFGEVNGSGAGTLATITGSEGKFPHLLDGGSWAVRGDVMVRGVVGSSGNGPLTAGSFGSSSTRFGPELGFGHVMGNFHAERVLLIKCPRGGRDLGYQFLPPGSPSYIDGANTFAGYGDSPQSWLTGSTPVPDHTYAGEQWDLSFLDEADWAPAGASKPPITNVTDILDQFATEYPSRAAQGFEIAGFVWWQGYNDKQGSSVPLSYSVRYAENMARVITKIREYYEGRYPGKGAQSAPFVLGTLGEGGWGPKQEKHQNVIDGQLAVDGRTGNYPAFADQVRTVETRGFWRDRSISPTGQGHHYNHNAETYMLAGDTLARAMIDLKSPGLVDSEAPQLIQLFPPDRAAGVRVNSRLDLTFSEPIAIGSGNVILKNLGDNTVTLIPITDPNQVSSTGFRLTIRPDVALAAGQDYAVQLASGAVVDLAGNAFSGISDDPTWVFATIPADVTPPPVPTINLPLGPVKTNQITVSVAPVADPDRFPVEYRFRNLTLGTDSGWKISPSWTDSGLTAGTRYVYTVQSRDTSPSLNKSADASIVSTKTLAVAPTIQVNGVFTYKADLGPAGDNWNIDTGGADKPIVIDTVDFDPVGSDKLVGVVSLFNSADSVSAVTSLTFGGVDVLANLVTGNPGDAAGFSGRRMIFHLDHPGADGDLVIGLGANDHVDEVGVALFALDGTRPGHATGVSGGGNPAQVEVFSGDFVVGVAQRNNQSQSVTNAPPYTSLDLRAGSLISLVGYAVAEEDGPTAPVFSNTSGIVHSIAVFEAMAPVPSAYELWASSNAPTTAENTLGDEDGDGVPNYIEFIVGGSDATNDRDRLPELRVEHGNVIFRYERAQSSIDPGTTTEIEVSEDLDTWPSTYAIPDVAAIGPPVSVEKNSSPGFDRVTLSLPIESIPRIFARLKVEIDR